MSKDNEEKQLLEDASTLLMFANVAARQQSPSSPQQSKPHTQPQVPSAAATAATAFSEPKQAYSQIKATGVLPPLAAAPPPSYGSSLDSTGIQKPGLTQAPQVPSHLQPHGALPHIIPGYPYYPYGYGGQLPPHTGLLPASAPPLQPNALLQPFSPLMAPQPHPATELSVSEPKERDTRRLLSATPLLLTSVSGLGVLPAQGKFQTHNRTPSGGFHPPKQASPHVGSPGPASVALARGINVETGKRNNNNAVIAAAALAAAAENPLPLKTVEATPPKLQLPKKEQPALDASLTEPEDDANKTDDEQPNNGSEAELLQKTESSRLDTGQASAPQPPLDAIGVSPPVKSPLARVGESEEISASAIKKEPSPAEIYPPKESVAQVLQKPTAYEVPPLESYKVHPDSGVIGCICGIEEDDGFTIQCDVCYRWQHCMCMGYQTNEEVPEDEYKCYYCDESKNNKFDSIVCKHDTLRRLDMEKVSSEPPEKPPTTKRKTLNSGNDDKKRRKSEKEIKVLPTERPSADKRKPSKSNGIVPSAAVQQIVTKICNKENCQLEDGVSAEAYQGVYYKLTANDYKTPGVKATLLRLGISFEAAKNSASAIETVPLAVFQGMKFSKIILPRHQQHLQEKNEIGRKMKYNETSIQVKPYSDNPKQRYVGVPKIGVFISDRLDRSGQEVIVPIGTAVMEYLGEVDYFELYATSNVNQYDSWGTFKPRVAKVDLSITPHTSPSSFVLDSRFVGNETRFIRKSCVHTANCVVKPIYIPELKAFKFIVYTTKPIVLKGENMEEELRLPWQWDVNHPISKMIKVTNSGEYEEGEKFEDFSDEEKVLLVSGVDKILNFVECACNTTSLTLMCLIFKVKKATSYLLRSTRKASSLSNIAYNKSKEELVMPKKDRKFVSWKERLIERDQAIRLVMSLDNSGNKDNLHEEGGSIGIFESKNDGEPSTISIHKIIDDSTPNFPFNRRVFAQGKRYASRNFRFESGTPENVDEANIMLSVPKIMAVPLVSEILSTIKDTVKSKLQPAITVGAPHELKRELLSTDLITSALPQKAESPVPSKLKEEVVIENIPKPAPPPTVKKLSFADYKKKMK